MKLKLLKRELLKRATAVILIVAVLVSMFVGTGISASAAVIDEPVGLGSITINQGGRYKYQSSIDFSAFVYTTSNGYKAFCLEPAKASPTGGASSKTFAADKISRETNANVLKALYYGYSGYGFNTEYSTFRSTNSYASTVKGYMNYLKSTKSLNGCSGDVYYYAMTHLVAAYIKYGSASSSSILSGTWQSAVRDIGEKIKTLPSVSDKMRAYIVNTGSNSQKMIYPVFKIKLELQKNCVQGSQSFVNGKGEFSLEGARFVVFTDKSKAETAAKAAEQTPQRYEGRISSYIPTNKSGYGEYSYVSPGALVDSNKTYYALEFLSPPGYAINNNVYTFKDSNKTDTNGVPIYSVTVSDTPKIALSLKKVSGNTTITAGNSCYSLKGAEYTIYTDSKCTTPFNGGAKIITDVNGNGTYSGGALVTAQDLWAKETKPSPGYQLDRAIHKFTYSGKKNSKGYPIYSFTSTEEPDSDPVTVILQKYDATTGKGTNQEKLANAEYRINFYAAKYNSVAEIGKKAPTRSWVFKTNANGFLNYSAAYKVSGDDFYYDEGAPTIPYGTITVQEITAPPGYQLNPEIFLANITGEGDKLSWRTTNENIDGSVLLFPETEDNGGLEIRKTSDDNKVADLWFRVSSKTYSKDFCTDSSGLIINDELSNLPIDEMYTIEELGLKGADGNYYYPKRYGDKPEPQTVTLQIGKTTTVSFRNTVIPAALKVIKTSDDGKNDYVYFSLKASDGTEYPNLVTGDDGTAEVNNLPIYDDNDNAIKYTVEELGLSNGDGTYSVPDRYNKPEPQTFTLVDDVTDTNGTVVKSVMFHNTYRKGQLTITKLYNSLGFNVSVNSLWFNVSSSAGYNKDVAITYIGTWQVIIDDLDVYDSTGEPIAYTITELGFKDQTSGEYKFPSHFYRTEPQTVYLSESSIQNQVYSKFVTFMNRVKAVKLHLTKQSTDGDVSGISFKLTSDSGFSSIAVTDQNGELTIRELPILNASGDYITYTLEELGISNGDGTYTIPPKYKIPEVMTFTLEEYDTDENFSLSEMMGSYELLPAYKTLEIEFSNEPKFGTLEITKKSDDGITSDLFFNVKDSKGNDYGNQQTGATGVTTYTGLRVYDENNQPITYTVTELGFEQPDGSFKLPDKYKTPAVIQTTLLYDETVELVTRVTATNNVYPGNLRIIKTADDNDVSGIYFRITNETTSSVVGDFATNASGIIYIEQLPVCADGTIFMYKVEELGFSNGDGTYTIPNKYVKPLPQYITLTANGTAEVYFHNSVEQGYAGIKKTDNSGKNVPNCKFGIYSSAETDKDGNLLSENLIDTCVSDSNGNGVFKTALSIGTFYIQEIEPAPGYSRNTEYTSVKVTASNSSIERAAIVSFVNYPTRLTVKKFDPFGKYVSGAWLICEDSDGNRVERWRTAEEPHVIYGLIIGDTYKVYEQSPPNGYAPAEPIYITIQDDFLNPNINDVEMVDDFVGSVVVHKKESTGVQGIRGSRWEIRDIYGEKITAYQNGVGMYTYSKTVANLYTVFDTDLMGDLYVNDLPTGDYVLVEVEPPNGYMPYGYEIPFTISANSTTTLFYEFEVQDNKAVLNSTGSIGTAPFYSAGCLFSASAIMTIAIYFKKRKTSIERTKKK